MAATCSFTTGIQETQLLRDITAEGQQLFPPDLRLTLIVHRIVRAQQLVEHLC